MPNEVAPNHNDALASCLSRCLAVAVREQSNEQLGREFWTSWCAYKLQAVRVRVDGLLLDPIPLDFLQEFMPAFVEAVRIETFKEDTDNESLVGIEKALLLCTSGNYAAAGKLIRQHFARRTTLTSAMNELATGHHRQSAFAGNGRPDHLQRVLTEMVEQKLDITPREAKEELKAVRKN